MYYSVWQHYENPFTNTDTESTQEEQICNNKFWKITQQNTYYTSGYCQSCGRSSHVGLMARFGLLFIRFIVLTKNRFRPVPHNHISFLVDYFCPEGENNFNYYAQLSSCSPKDEDRAWIWNSVFNFGTLNTLRYTKSKNWQVQNVIYHHQNQTDQ